jgi:hypothetical protein
MPNGIFPVPEFRPVPARTRLSLAVRIRTRWRRDRLDKELSHGADPPPVTSSAYAPPSSARQRYALSLPKHWSRGWATPAETSR